MEPKCKNDSELRAWMRDYLAWREEKARVRKVNGRRKVNKLPYPALPAHLALDFVSLGGFSLTFEELGLRSF